MRKKFIVEVPCTIVDRYFIFAESEDDARQKMAGRMTEQTLESFGDYILDATTDEEAETHWDRAVIVGEEDLVVDRCSVCDAIVESKAAFFGFCSEKCLRESNKNPKPPVKFSGIQAVADKTSKREAA